MKFTHMCAVAALAGFAAVSAVSAGTVTFTAGPFNNSPNVGGEYIATLDTGSSFRVFCLERFEPISTVSGQNTFLYDGFDSGETGAIEGGPGATGGSDGLSNATAQLYINWMNGTIPNNVANNNAVQYAIWWLESEINFGTIGAAFGAVSLAATQDLINNFTGGFDNSQGASDFDSANFPNIRVLNPYRIINGERVEFQSMIILIPLPAASGMALAGLALVGGIRRRR